MIVNNKDFEQPDYVKDLKDGEAFTEDFENFFILTSAFPADNTGIQYAVNLKTGEMKPIDEYKKVRKVIGNVSISYE